MLPRVEMNQNVFVLSSRLRDKLQDGGFAGAPLAVDTDPDRPIVRASSRNAVEFLRERPTIQIILFAPLDSRIEPAWFGFAAGWAFHLSTLRFITRLQGVFGM